MSNEPLVPLPGSERAPIAGAAEAGPADAAASAELTLVLRRQAEGVPGASAADIAAVETAMNAAGLTVTSVHAQSRRVKVAGTLGALSEAFGTTVRLVRSGGTTHRYREGGLAVPASLDGVVTAVLGLDTRPQARPHFRPAAAAAGPSGYSPAQVAQAYGFPAGTDGTGQRIALVELGGGFSASDLSAYFGGLGIKVPSVTAARVDGASNAPGSDPQGADVEVSLDINVCGAAAPGAAQIVYFAPNTDQGFVDAVADAAHATPAPVAISISWGQSEDQWTAQARTALDGVIADACTLGITVCVAAGDNGSSDGASDGLAHVDFPASSPHALACGGTRLEISSGGAAGTETVWNDGAQGGAGGGGISDAFPVPSWQAGAGIPASANPASGTAAPAAAPAAHAAEPPEHRRPTHSGHTGHGGHGGHGSGTSATGRGVPDVAGNADPQTGYRVLAGGNAQIVGGTSAVAPLWAALIARVAQATGTRFGLIQSVLYAGASPGAGVIGFRDITTGNNGAYAAGPGWDPCTGLGSPDGPALVARLKS